MIRSMELRIKDFPEWVRDELEREARSQERTVNGHVIFLLKWRAHALRHYRENGRFPDPAAPIGPLDAPGLDVPEQ